MENKILSEQGKSCLQSLLTIWFDFERGLTKIPVIQRLEQGRLSIEDYRHLLLNIRQQVIEGSRWISRCASSFDRHYSDVRSQVIGHAQEEHRDYEILEKDFVTAGGNLNDILNAPKNIGSEALHGFLMYRATQNNPIDLLGAMWIIEGVGNKMASEWAQRIDEVFVGLESVTTFMRYHGENDRTHMEKLYGLIDRLCQSEKAQESIERTAKVVARLYLLQLEEVDNA